MPKLAGNEKSTHCDTEFLRWSKKKLGDVKKILGMSKKIHGTQKYFWGWLKNDWRAKKMIWAVNKIYLGTSLFLGSWKMNIWKVKNVSAHKIYFHIQIIIFLEYLLTWPSIQQNLYILQKPFKGRVRHRDNLTWKVLGGDPHTSHTDG